MAKRSTRADKGLQQALDRTAKLYANGDPALFDYFAEDAIVYAVGSTEPFRGRNAYRKHFQPILTAEKRKISFLQQDVLNIDEGKAVVAQTAQITQGGVIAHIRQTMVWASDDGGWKVQHVHTTLVGEPTPAKMPTSASAIKVINERIATVAAVLGVAQ